MTGQWTRLALVLLLPLGGCATYSLQELRQATPQGTPFQQALSQQYLDFATRQEKAYDWFNSMHFADKGLMAAYGKDVAPEELKDWSLPPETLPSMQEARAALMAALTPETEARQPELAARAQAQFDCWVTYQEPNWQQEKISQCRDGLQDTLGQLGMAAPPAPVAAPVVAPLLHREAAVKQTAQSYLIFFESNHSDLAEAGKKIVDDLAQSLAGESGYEIILNGHTDTTGTQEYNLKLSQRRAQTVKNRLIDDGIDEAVIKLFAFGKSDPLVKSGDHKPEPKNRRVEIFINE